MKFTMKVGGKQRTISTNQSAQTNTRKALEVVGLLAVPVVAALGAAIIFGNR